MSKLKEIRYMTRDEVKEQFERFPVAVLPIGATEQHGHHLPLGTDILLAEAIAKEICKETGSVLLPSIPFGYSWVWRDIPGTVSLKQHHVEAVIKDVAHSLDRYGVRLLILVNGHDANNASMKYAVRELSDEMGMKVVFQFYPDLNQIIGQELESETWHGMVHACEFETSMMLSFYPELVKMEEAVAEYPQKPVLYGKSDIMLGDLSESGVFGDATKATKEKGDRLRSIFLAKMLADIEEACKELKIGKTSMK